MRKMRKIASLVTIMIPPRRHANPAPLERLTMVLLVVLLVQTIVRAFPAHPERTQDH